MRDCPCQPLTLGPIQAGEMIDVKSNFKHPQFNSSRQVGSGGQRLATQLGQPDKTYGSSLPAGVFVCMHGIVCVAFLLETAYFTQEPSVLHLKGRWRVLLYRQGCRFLPVLWFCRGSTQSFRRSLRKWTDVYTCALVCASSRYVCAC